MGIDNLDAAKPEPESDLAPDQNEPGDDLPAELEDLTVTDPSKIITDNIDKR